MNKTTLSFKRSLYPKEAVMKAAYHFIDRAYIHVDCSANEYIVELTGKSGKDVEAVAREFENELLSQTVRYQVFLQTHVLREVLMARAMSSTITGDDTELKSADVPEKLDDLENILTDWFKKNEE